MTSKNSTTNAHFAKKRCLSAARRGVRQSFLHFAEAFGTVSPASVSPAKSGASRTHKQARHSSLNGQAPHSGNHVSLWKYVMRIIVFSGWGLGRRLFQKGGLPNVSPHFPAARRFLSRSETNSPMASLIRSGTMNGHTHQPSTIAVVTSLPARTLTVWNQAVPSA